MTNNQHGQVPEALIDLIDAYAETRHRYGRIHNARTEAARKAVIEALSGVQALSAAPRTPTVEQVEDEVSMGHGAWDMVDPQELIGAVLRLSVAASPTPPAELQAAPKAAQGVGNSGFDHKTAADLLNNKTVSDEAVRKFVATSRWAHDEKAALSAMLLSVRGVLASREAEIALLKKALLEAEAAPQQEAQEHVYQARYKGGDWQDSCRERNEYLKNPELSQAKDWELRVLYTAPQPAPAPLSDDVVRDAALWHWLAEYLVGTRTDLDDEIVASKTVNDLRKLVEVATQQAGEMEVFCLQWPGEDRINLSTVFDTEAEALEYMQNRCDTPGIRLVRFSSKAPTAQGGKDAE